VLRFDETRSISPESSSTLIFIEKSPADGKESRFRCDLKEKRFEGEPLIFEYAISCHPRKKPLPSPNLRDEIEASFIIERRSFRGRK
jgi:hypothetical protein